MNKGRYFWGIVLVIVGILFLGNNLNWWGIKIFFKGWWSLFIIIPSIKGLFNKETYAASVISLTLGILLLLASQKIIAWSMIWKVLVPVTIMMVGISLIFNIKFEKALQIKNAKKYIAIFSNIEEALTDSIEDFKTISIFGSIDLDLRKIKIKKDLVIEAITIFGGIDLKVPDNVKIKITGVPIFGGVEYKTLGNEDAKKTIYLNYTCIFGGIDII